MDKMIAYCGLVCTDCDGYIATQANDLEALERVAQRAREEFGVADATAESVQCDGCLAENGRQIGYCATCEIRACGAGRGVVNCAHCADYACETLEGFLGQVPEARETLEEIRQRRIFDI
jgi:hypothetical protein